MSKIYYAGIGSRKTPENVCSKMHNAGKAMASLGFILRSGGAAGADESFESGVQRFCEVHSISPDVLQEIYLPFKRFRKNDSPLFGTTREARQIAKQYHPNWEILGCNARDFMGRNAYQILGKDLNHPVDFVLCWTPNGQITGGTGQALRHATDLNIPIFNFAIHSDDEISDFIFALNERKNP